MKKRPTPQGAHTNPYPQKPAKTPSPQTPQDEPSPFPNAMKRRQGVASFCSRYLSVASLA